jgi:diguanylate cyclase
MVPNLGDEAHYDAITQAKRYMSSDPASAAKGLKQIADDYKSQGLRVPSLEARRYQCFAHINDLNLDDARQVAQQFLREATEANEQRYIGISQMYMGVIALEGGDHEYSVELFEEALTIAKSIEDRDLASRVQMNLGNGFFNLERYEDAVTAFKAAIENLDAEGGANGLGAAFYNVASGYSMVAYSQAVAGEDNRETIQLVDEYISKAWQAEGLQDVYKQYIRICESLQWSLKKEFEYGLRILDAVERDYGDKVVGSIESAIWTTRCCIYDLAEDWTSLRIAAAKSLELADSRGNFRSYGQSLSISAKAEAKLHNYARAYHFLKRANDLVKDRIQKQTNQRAQILGVKLEVQKTKFDQQVLRMRNQFLVERNRVLEQEVKVDRLTQVLNRRGIEEVLMKLAKERNFVVGLLDIDYFKKVNDQFGHGIGDEVLTKFAQLLVSSETGPTVIGRWGGEEFLIVLEDLNGQVIEDNANAIVHEVKAFDWNSIQPGLSLTTSLGLALHRAGHDVYETVKVADENLYEAKRSGRDRWIFNTLRKAA